MECVYVEIVDAFQWTDTFCRRKSKKEGKQKWSIALGESFLLTLASKSESIFGHQVNWQVKLFILVIIKYGST